MQAWAVVVDSSEFLKIRLLAKFMNKTLVGINKLQQMIHRFLAGYLVVEVTASTNIFVHESLEIL